MKIKCNVYGSVDKEETKRKVIEFFKQVQQEKEKGTRNEYQRK